MSERSFPAPNDWPQLPADGVGMDAGKLGAALAYAAESEIAWPRDVGRTLSRFEKPPYDRVLGPTKPRGPAGGVVIRRGACVARWGDPLRADMTFSAAKSYLSLLAGIAFDRGLLDPDARVCESVDDGGFEGSHNGLITWEQLLQQTSEWQGTLFGIPDSVDHNRSVGGAAADAEKGTPRQLQEPGSFWEYNDVRVNRLGLALLRIFGEALPDVLRREVMDPIGASQTWEWYGYRNSWVDLNGRRVQSVPGGAHWGGGIWISSFDHARVGYLLLCGGSWAGKRILSQEWIDRATTPCRLNSGYGYMWWLNAGGLYPALSKRAFAAQGAGGNVVIVDPELDLVLVTRWAGDVPGLVERVVAAIES